MDGLDTNVLVRYITLDHKEHSKIATSIIDKAKQKGEKLYINLVVVCELIWVLSGPYEYQKNDIVELLSKLFSIKDFEIESLDVLWKAIDVYRNSNFDFEDILIGELNSSSKCETTYTFDKGLKKASRFSVL